MSSDAEHSDAMSSYSDGSESESVELERITSWPGHVSAPVDILQLYNTVAASPRCNHDIQQVLSLLPDIIGTTNKARLTKTYGQSYCRRMLELVSLLLRHEKTSTKPGAPGTLQSIMASELLERTEEFEYVANGVQSLARRSPQRSEIQRSMESAIRETRSDIIETKRVSTVRGLQRRNAAICHASVQKRIAEFARLGLVDVEMTLEYGLLARDLPRVGITDPFLSVRHIQLSNNWAPVPLEDPTSAMDVDDVAHSDSQPTVNVAIRAILSQSSTLEKTSFSNPHAVGAWRTTLARALIVVLQDLSQPDPARIESMVPALLAATFGLCQMRASSHACSAIELVVLSFRDQFLRNQACESTRRNLVQALGILSIIFCDGRPSDDEYESRIESASVAASEAIKLLEPVVERDGRRYQEILATLKIRNVLCVLAPEDCDKGELPGAKQVAIEAVELSRRAVFANPTSWEAKVLLASALYVRTKLKSQEKPNSNLTAAPKEAIKCLREVVEMRPGPRDVQLAEVLHSFAKPCTQDSQDLLSKAVATYEQLSTTFPGQFSDKLGDLNWHLAVFHLLRAEYEQAEPRLTQATEHAGPLDEDQLFRSERSFARIMLEKYLAAFEDAHSTVLNNGLHWQGRECAKILSERGYSTWMLDHPDEGLRDLKSSVQMFQQVRRYSWDNDNSKTAISFDNLHPVRRHGGQLLDDEHANALAWLGALQCAMGDQEDALRNGAEALRLMRLSRACCRTEAESLAGDLKLARVLVYWSATLLNAGRGQEASRNVDESIELMRSRARSDSAFKTALLMKERMLAEDGQTSEAAEIRSEADTIPYQGFLSKLGRPRQGASVRND
ncbi:hypothetical protein A4X13_0g3865 [Tilletia indica]|uniref:Uncharacterized protein n=1 Tax=Tilletia indica TaxID=43049 RepID=A0A177THM3_9BASI|nr:hypothetical protein A4X13_0g3865 [Tilletia indica]